MKKILLLIVPLIIFASCTNEKNQVIEIPFDFDWKFALNDQTGAENIDFNDNYWQDISIPHDYSILQPFDSTNTTGKGGGYAFSGMGWYRKTFQLPENAENKRITITFNGVYRNSQVWINGHFLGERPNGYISFTYDLTPYINYDKDNVIAVKVDSGEQPGSRWYSGAGIYRHVNLHICNPIHLVNNGIFIQTENIGKHKAIINISSEIESNLKRAVAIGLRISVTNPWGKKIYQNTQTVQVKPNQVNSFEKSIRIRKPNIWSIENPQLYSVKVELVENKKILDNFNTKYGLRTFKFDPDKGFFLNGQHVKIKGTNNHHDGGPLGAACQDYTFKRQLKILKEMGCNALRMSHNPPAPELLDCADSLGFIVIDEIFDEWKYSKVPHNYADDFDEWYAKDIANWMRRDRNHPSIVAWSLGNEIPEQKSGQEGVDRLNMLIETAKKHDTSRPFTSACNEIIDANKSGFSSALGIVGYNYQEPNYKKDHQTYPDRVIYGSETVIYPYQPGEGFPLHSYAEWIEGQQQDYVAGEFLWTGFDYLGESGIGLGGTGLEPWNEWPQWLYRSAICGVVDICGFTKPAYMFRKALWTDEPMVSIAVPVSNDANNIQETPFWGWPNVLAHWDNITPGDTVTVQVYTNCPEVELFLNGNSLGTKKWDITNKAFLTWDIAYQPGTLKAIAKTTDGKNVTEFVKTAGSPNKILLSTHKTTLKANGQDITYVELQLLDKDGNLSQFDSKKINFTIEGEGKLLAVGNGDPASHTPFNGQKMETYHGKCLAIIQSTKHSGQISLHAYAEEVTSATIVIATKYKLKRMEI